MSRQKYIFDSNGLLFNLIAVLSFTISSKYAVGRLRLITKINQLLLISGLIRLVLPRHKVHCGGILIQYMEHFWTLNLDKFDFQVHITYQFYFRLKTARAKILHVSVRLIGCENTFCHWSDSSWYISWFHHRLYLHSYIRCTYIECTYSKFTYITTSNVPTYLHRMYLHTYIECTYIPASNVPTYLHRIYLHRMYLHTYIECNYIEYTYIPTSMNKK